MKVLGHLKPEKVFQFFEEICAIPHGSYAVDEISDYLAAFARERNLEHTQDELKNVVINLPASEGYEKEEAVILQGHMDMVAVKDADCGFDLAKDGLALRCDDKYIWAEGTSLGGDDGIAVAYALAILDSPEIEHPALQAVFTVNEEVGMDGAIGISPSLFHANRMLNIDSEEEGIFTVGCAGGTKAQCTRRMETQHYAGPAYEIKIGGLRGGHSGTMIHLGRANACVLMGRLLLGLKRTAEENGYALQLLEIGGGEKSNAIPAGSGFTFGIQKKSSAGNMAAPQEKSAVGSAGTMQEGNAAGNMEIPLSRMEKVITDFVRAECETIRKEFAGKEDGVVYDMKSLGGGNRRAVSAEDTERILKLLVMQPDGVQSRNSYMESLVETSLNLGIVSLSDEEDGSRNYTAVYELRSSVKSSRAALKDKVLLVAQSLGFEMQVLGEYPEWEYRNDSPLQKKMIRVYEEMYGEKPAVDIIHAGLECGVFAEKIEDLDAVSFGPNILDIHTTKEKLDIESTKRVWEFLLRLLREKG